MSFFTKFFAVEADKGADALMNMLIGWDPTSATEAEKRMIAAKLSEFCVKCEEAKKKMHKEEADVVAVKAQAADKLALAKSWQTQIADPATDEGRKKQLEDKLPGLMAELAQFGPKIDKEIREAEVAKRLFNTYDQVVITTNEKLQQKIAQTDQNLSELEIARAEKALAKEEVDAARVLAGIQRASDSFNVASAAIAQKTATLQSETAGMQREAALLTAKNKDDEFVATELAKMKGTGNTTTSITDQLASLEAKLK
jgi:hypothetical protein